MRKNKLMRAAAGLMVATLLTTSIISGTLAKYTVTDSGTDTARVAKFGVAITANGTTFAKSYKNDNQIETVTSSTTDKNVIAPGTKGNMASMKLTGTPEVSVKVSYKGEFSFNDVDKWKLSDGSFYCPLVIKVDQKTINGATYTDADKFVKDVNDAIAAYSKEYGPNTDLAGESGDSLAISWEWPYSADDTKDTALGKAAAENNAGEVTLKVTTTVTQID